MSRPRWLALEQVLHILPVCPRPNGYDPLILQNLIPEWIARLGQAGPGFFSAILRHDSVALGAAYDCYHETAGRCSCRVISNNCT